MTSQHGAYALQAGLAKLYALMRMHAPGHPHSRTHTHTHTQICNTYSTVTINRERASKLLVSTTKVRVSSPS